ncbi:MAG: IclR family transcriptional regulator [Maritimibacter sp.]|nr:IclR family transcriptional regulator [Maritimibacter sp.]
MGTITKALEMLNYFSRSAPELGLSEFVRLSGRDKATVHRHLVELAENGFLEQHPDSRAYRLGPAILRLATVRETTAPTRAVVLPLIAALADEVGELVHFSLIQGELLSPVAHVEPGRHGTQVHFDPSEMLPLHATASGLAVLAFGPRGLRDRVLAGPLAAHASATVTDGADLAALVARVRQAGIARAEKSFDDEVTSQAAPVFGADGVAIGAVSIAVPLGRASDEKCAHYAAALRAGAARITEALGGTPARDPSQMETT